MLMPFILAFCGFGLRLLLMLNKNISDYLKGRIEISTPANSWKNAEEGIYLLRNGISPYSGDGFHEMPGFLWLLHYLHTNWQTLIPFVYSLVDVATAYTLSQITYQYLRQKIKMQSCLQSESLARKEQYVSECLLYSSDDLASLPVLVLICYLFNPFTILNCAAQTSTIYNNSLIALCLFFMLRGYRLLSMLLLALSAYCSLYSAILIVSVALYFGKENKQQGNKTYGSLSANKIMSCCLTFALLWIALLFVSSSLMGSWQFLEQTYGFLLTVPDLTPNVGLFWYFFTEMFDHFRLFFLWVFQINIIIYPLPLAIVLRNDPVFLYTILLMICSVFKPYPCIGDVGIFIALLPVWKYHMQYMRHGFVVVCTMICLFVLAPVMWHLWVVVGSANSNFYFAVTLAYSTAHIFLLTDLFYSYLRHRLHLLRGIKPKIGGKLAAVILE